METNRNKKISLILPKRYESFIVEIKKTIIKKGNKVNSLTETRLQFH